MNLHEDLPEAVIGMLHFIYGFGVSGDDCTSFHQIDLMTVADKYGVESLYIAAKANLSQRLGRLALPWADFYPDLLQDIYTTPACDEETRRLAVAVGQRDLQGWLQQEDFKKLLLEKSEIALDMLNAVATCGTDAIAAAATESEVMETTVPNAIHPILSFYRAGGNGRTSSGLSLRPLLDPQALPHPGAHLGMLWSNNSMR